MRTTAVLAALVLGLTACSGGSDEIPSKSHARLVFSDGHGFVTAPAAHPDDRTRLAAPPAFAAATPENQFGDEVLAAVAPTTGTIAGMFLVTPDGSWHGRQKPGARLAVWDGNLSRPRVVEDLAYSTEVEALSWSPDGRQLYFDHHLQDGRTTPRDRLMSTSLDGDGRVTVRPVPGGRGLLHPAISPDGTHLAAVRTSYHRLSPRPSKLVLLDLRSHRVSGPLVQDAFGQPAWSPDGQWLAVQTGDGITVVPTPTGAPPDYARVSVVRATPRMVPVSPAWASSTELWFTCSHPEMNDDVPEPPADLCSVPMHAGRPGRVVNRTATAHSDERRLSTLPQPS